MKHYTSRFLKSVAFFFLSFPVSYILFAAILFDIPLNQCFRILLSPLYYLVAFTAVGVGYGLWEMKKWAWYLFLVLSVMIAYENAILVQDYSESHHKIMAFVTSAALLFLMIIRVGREIRVPYFFPKIRWWESNPRYRTCLPVKFGRKDGPIDAEILDISMGGCFVKLRTEVSLDEKIGLRFAAFGQVVECEGLVVWRTGSTVTHPKGVGIKFGALPREQKRALKTINRRLKKIAALYRRSRYLMNQDEFIRRLEEIENQGIDQLRTS